MAVPARARRSSIGRRPRRVAPVLVPAVCALGLYSPGAFRVANRRVRDVGLLRRVRRAPADTIAGASAGDRRRRRSDDRVPAGSDRYQSARYYSQLFKSGSCAIRGPYLVAGRRYAGPSGTPTGAMRSHRPATRTTATSTGPGWHACASSPKSSTRAPATSRTATGTRRRRRSAVCWTSSSGQAPGWSSQTACGRTASGRLTASWHNRVLARWLVEAHADADHGR